MKTIYTHYCNETFSKDWYIALMADGSLKRFKLSVTDRRTGEVTNRRFKDFGKAWDAFHAAEVKRNLAA